MPKVLLLILFGLLGLPVIGFSGRGGGQRHMHACTKAPGAEMHQAGNNRVAVAAGFFSDCDRPVLERHDLRIGSASAPKIHGPQHFLLPSPPAAIDDRYVARQKTCSSEYRERSFDYYGLLIYPHHDFW